MIVRRAMRNLLPRKVALRLRREWLARRLAVGKGHFEDDVPLLDAYVKPTDVCWDIGANIGMYTLPLSRLAFSRLPHVLVPQRYSTVR